MRLGSHLQGTAAPWGRDSDCRVHHLAPATVASCLHGLVRLCRCLDLELPPVLQLVLPPSASSRCSSCFWRLQMSCLPVVILAVPPLPEPGAW